MYSNVTKQTALSVDLVKVCRYCVNIVNVFPHTREVDDQPFPQVNAYFMYCPYKIMHRWQYIFTKDNVFLQSNLSMHNTQYNTQYNDNTQYNTQYND